MLGWLIFEPLSGIVSDRVNRRVMITFALVSTSIIYFLYPFATEFIHFLTLAFALSSFYSASSVPTRALLTELLPSTGRGQKYGRYMAMVSGASVVAPFVGGYISETLGYSLPFYTAASAGILSIIVVVLMGKLPESDKRVQKPKAILTDVLNTDILNLYVVRGLYFINFPFRSSFLPILLNESASLHATETEIGIYMTIVSLTTAVSQVFIGDLIDRVGSKKVVVVACSLLALSYLGIIAASWMPLLFVIGALQGVFQAGGDTSMMVYLMSLQSPGSTGVVMGLYAEAENIGGIIVNPALGYVYTVFGPVTSLLLLSFVLIVTSGISAIRLKTTTKSS
jgi:MFS family permease